MRKFKGQINGVEYTDIEEFEIAYKLLTETANPTDRVSVSYTIEEVDEKDTCEKKSCCLEDSRGNRLTEDDNQKMCDAVEKIRDIVTDITGRIQSYIDADTQIYRNMREFRVTTDAAITKIRWIVQSLPAAARKELCKTIYESTKEMVDNINSELIDMRYELSKRQEMIGGEITEIENDIKEIDSDIEELQKESSDLYNDIGDLQKEYERNENKVSTFDIATDFFDNLLGSFEL